MSIDALGHIHSYRGWEEECAHASVIEEMRSIFLVEQKELSISQKKDAVETA